MHEHLRKILGYLESESYLMAYRAVSTLAAESEASVALDRFTVETKTDIDVLHTCLRIIVGERAGNPEVARFYAQTVSFYERLALVLTRRLLGDKAADNEVDALMFCQEALVKTRRN